jgi:hypothetical protein
MTEEILHACFGAKLCKRTHRKLDTQSGKSRFGSEHENKSVRLCVDADVGEHKTTMRIILICFVAGRLSCVKSKLAPEGKLLLSYPGELINGQICYIQINEKGDVQSGVTLTCGTWLTVVWRLHDYAY